MYHKLEKEINKCECSNCYHRSSFVLSAHTLIIKCDLESFGS